MRGRRSGRWLAMVLGLVTLFTVSVVIVPVLLLRPFSPQTPAMVATAYALRTISPWLAPSGLALSTVLGAFYVRRRPRRPQLAAAVLAVAVAGGAAWLSFQNHFEWMFAPLPSAAYARARDTTFVSGADMVVAVEAEGDAVAYPVRQMAYHHLVNDDVGTLPVVSTY